MCAWEGGGLLGLVLMAILRSGVLPISALSCSNGRLALHHDVYDRRRASFNEPFRRIYSHVPTHSRFLMLSLSTAEPPPVLMGAQSIYSVLEA